MKLYDKFILPSLINWACKLDSHMQQREKVIPQAVGDVLEIGVGSGLNLPIYVDSKVKSLTAIDPSEETWKKNIVDLSKLPFQFKYVKGSAEDMPFDNAVFDTVVVTYSLCTIPDATKALKEMKRVLKPGGKLIFCEHGMAPDQNVLQIQNVLNPVWKRFAGGCNLNKNIPELIKNAGFKFVSLNTMYIPGPKPFSYNYWGVAE